MTDRHKYHPIAYRPPQAVRGRLLAYAEKTGRAVNAVITEAVTRLLDEPSAMLVSHDWYEKAKAALETREEQGQ